MFYLYLKKKGYWVYFEREYKPHVCFMSDVTMQRLCCCYFCLNTVWFGEICFNTSVLHCGDKGDNYTLSRCTKVKLYRFLRNVKDFRFHYFSFKFESQKIGSFIATPKHIRHTVLCEQIVHGLLYRFFHI